MLVIGNFSFAHQAPKVSVSRNVVEAMIVNAGVGNMSGHPSNRVVSANLQKALLACGIELQQGRAELESLCPISPTSRGVFSFSGKDWRCVLPFPIFFDVEDFRRGNIEEPLDFRPELLRAYPIIDLDCHARKLTGS